MHDPGAGHDGMAGSARAGPWGGQQRGRQGGVSTGAVGRKPTISATLRWAREQHIRSTIERLAAAGGSAADLPPELREALQHKEHTDKYITTFLRQAGGWSKWQRTCRQAQGARTGPEVLTSTASGLGIGSSSGNSLGGTRTSSAMCSAINAALRDVHEMELQVDNPDGQDFYFGLEDEDADDDGLE
mmetsp:Transcript_15958/g.42012  ORF Transcript_15958/g.42012 Transcript_15958/m.42012 type:complete len:187 (-) Transcript_15958:1711-2271(-)